MHVRKYPPDIAALKAVQTINEVEADYAKRYGRFARSPNSDHPLDVPVMPRAPT